ncbi:DEKNAAC103464 [Brettanomyces naardenensis]|uniref:DEKNAAC103464 n=1 Tax=Brettanomyces naardenensis TaxID=13370 RepID=A0A448YNQ8_BRENA|nr:DEKNAAC103464 [Brettanomyces naardenensis]
MRRGINIAVIGGLLMATSYLSITRNGLHADSSITSSSPFGRKEAGIEKKDFSTAASTTDSVKNGGTGSQKDKQSIPIFNDEEVNRRLRRFEESYFVDRGKGVSRYDICQLPSNNPIEDDRSEKVVEVPIQDKDHNNERDDSDWYFWSVFDGHAGWTTSAKLRDELVDTVVSEMATSAYKVTDDNMRMVPTSDSIDRAIKAGFLKLDNEIVTENIQKLLDHPENKNAAAELLMPALCGSCALMSFYDSHTKRLKVAVTGDSRALLGSLNDNDEWTVNSLSVDQTGSSPVEVARLLSEHPNEPNVIRNGRILGSLEPSRAFGDARYKWSRDLQLKIYNKFFGRQLPANLKTPPYVTAEPVVSTHDINPWRHDFLVMASDGLYEMLSNEEIVGLVVRWMEKQKIIKPKTSIFDSIFSRSSDSRLPKVIDVSDSSSKSQKQPFRKGGKGSTGKYILEDENVATHLIRNALSNGGNAENVNLLVSIPSPLSRRYRDDLTVTVVFFSDEDKKAAAESRTGGLEINRAATQGGLDKDVKAKL